MGTTIPSMMRSMVASRLLRGLTASSQRIPLAHIACVPSRSTLLPFALQRRSLASLPEVLELEVEDETATFQQTLDELRSQASQRAMELTETKGMAELRFTAESDPSSAVTVKFHCQDSVGEADKEIKIKFNVTIAS